MRLDRWWETDPEEIYWLEITDRINLGEDLNAPQRRDDGREFWDYSLINEIRDGDIILHYHKGEGAIVAWSRASGSVWEDTVLWEARDSSTHSRYPSLPPTRVARGARRLQPSGSTSNAELRAREPDLSSVSETLVAAFGSNIYFPVNFYPGSMRPAQGYLAKMPRAVLEMFPSLAAAAAEGRSSDRAARRPGAETATFASSPDLGAEYRREDEDIAVAQRDPTEFDQAYWVAGRRGMKGQLNRLKDREWGPIRRDEGRHYFPHVTYRFRRRPHAARPASSPTHR